MEREKKEVPPFLLLDFGVRPRVWLSVVVFFLNYYWWSKIGGRGGFWFGVRVWRDCV